MKKHSVLLLLTILALTLNLVPASAATYYYINSTVKVREEPNAEANAKDSCGADFAVISYRKYDSNWAYVQFSDGTEGYVMRKFLKSSSTASAYVKYDETVLREGPGESFAQTGVLSGGSRIRVLTGGSSWSYVSTDAGKGYLRREDLSSSAAGHSSRTAFLTDRDGKQITVRRGPGEKKYEILTSLEEGTRVTVLSSGKGWARIQCDRMDGIGYVRTEHLADRLPGAASLPDSAEADASVPEP